MALVIAYDEAKTNQVKGVEDIKRKRRGRGSGTHTQFFGSRDRPDLPIASLNQHDQGYFNGPHFHIVDQFQVCVDGKGTLGRHELTPYDVHFTRAYTPYGPLVSNESNGLTFFVMRAHGDPGGGQGLPQALDQLKQVPDRQPWQILRPAIFPAFPSGTAATDIMLHAVPDIKDEQGLAAYTLSMKPNAKAYAPDPSDGDGQYLAVVKGSMLHDNKEYKALALVFVYPKEGPFQIHAGPGGLEALVLNFPRPQTRAARAATRVQTRTEFKTWQCTLCAFVYDEAAGLPEEGIAPGTRWKDVPKTWTCPDCNSSKGDFQMIEL